MPKISATSVAEHKARTWVSLLDAVDALILDRSFESITMSDVAGRAGVSRTAIYNYAPDTITLLIEAAKRGSAEMSGVIARYAGDESVAPSERLRAIVRALLSDHAKSTSAFLAVLGIERSLDERQVSEAVVPFRVGVGGHIAGVVRAGVDAGEFALVVEPTMLLPLMVGVMQAALQSIAKYPADADRVTEVAAQFLINALSGPRP